MSKPSDLGSLKIGSYILLPVGDQPTGEPCRISEYDTSKPGKHGAAKARIVGVGVFDGAKRPHVGPVSMQVHVPLIDKRLKSCELKHPKLDANDDWKSQLISDEDYEF